MLLWLRIGVFGDGDLLQKLERCISIETLHLWTADILLNELFCSVPTFSRMEKDVIPFPVCRRVYEAPLKGDNGNG